MYQQEGYNENINTKFINMTQNFIDPETGEKIQVTGVYKKVYGSKLFYKVWLTDLLEALGLVSNSRQMDVLFYIFDNVNADNVFIGTIRDIAETTKASPKTISKTIHKALDADIMRLKQQGVYIVNPKFIMRGSDSKKQRLVIEYENMAKKEDNQLSFAEDYKRQIG